MTTSSKTPLTVQIDLIQNLNVVRHTRRVVCFMALFLLWFSISVAQDSVPDQLIFVWDGEIYAQSSRGGAPRSLGEIFPGMLVALPHDTMPDVYSLQDSPLNALPYDDYGFFHGIWSIDRTQFVYMTIRNNSRDYRLHLWQDDQSEILLDSAADAERGFLEPLAFDDDGDLLLMERQKLHKIDSLRLWRLALDRAHLSLYATLDMRALYGRSAVSPDGSSTFIGFNDESKRAYYIDLRTGEIIDYFVNVADAEPPKSIFELYPAPFMTLGLFPGDELPGLTQRLLAYTVDMSTPPRPGPFLYWPLADQHRGITCYPDSRWTAANFAFTCPGLVPPIMYKGHQGTDIGGLPNGLPIGTDVYPALPGIVVKVNDRCGPDDPLCGSAYGNIIMLEHVLAVDGSAQSWFTGYAHLDEVLTTENTIITDLTEPIARSGATGVGGAHLHFEVRVLSSIGKHEWIDPWGSFYRPYDGSLWLGGNDAPLAFVGANR